MGLNASLTGRHSQKLKTGWSFDLARILLLSNGHGEDLSGALIGKALKKLDHEVDALPFVGHGNSYKSAGITTLGKTREFSTGGLGYTSFYGRLTELLQGQVFYLLRRLFCLFSIAYTYDLLVVIGDVVPLTAAWLTGLPVVIYLVAYSSHYEGKLRLPWPCANCLSTTRCLSIYTRDQLTAEDLTIQLPTNVEFLGNPFMDSVLIKQIQLQSCEYRIGLLPGSRRPELDNNLLLMLGVIELLPVSRLEGMEISFDIALVPSLEETDLRKLVALRGWEISDVLVSGSSMQLVKGQHIINVYRNCFSQVLQSSDILLCMAGTATEQAVGLAKPVLQLPGFGPQFTLTFAEAQRRLLGPTVFCANGRVGEESTLKNTGKLMLELLERSQFDSSLKTKCKQEALRRLGSTGGAKRIALAISEFLY